MEDLPSKVEVIILGTGLPESILAGACSRAGLSVLHLDRNNYYGGSWSSFNLKTIEEWIENVTADKSDYAEQIKVELAEGESILPLGKRKTVKNVKCEWKSASEKMTTVKNRNQEEVEMTFHSHLDQEWRRFSLDLVPKVILAQSDMVQTLIDSEVSKYAEFKLVDRFLRMERGEEGLAYNPVPCTKGDIFQDQSLSMIDKNRLMRILEFIQKWKISQEQKVPLNDKIFDEYRLKPFGDFLKSRFKISDELGYFLTDAIGILHPNATTEEGLEAVCTFINSTGRFGASPFLFPLYGCGELPQCFCRLSAVFGGLYCLDRRVESIVIKDKKVVGVIAAGKRIDCDVLIMSNEYVADEWLKKEGEWINRSVFITNKSIKVDPEKERISMVNLAQLNSNFAARLFEAGFEVCAAPRGYFVLNLTGKGDSEEDMKAVESKVFSGEGCPEALWSLHFMSLVDFQLEELPENVAVMPGADESLDFSSVLQLARQTFKSFWKDIDFLPMKLEKVETEEDQQV